MAERERVESKISGERERLNIAVDLEDGQRKWGVNTG